MGFNMLFYIIFGTNLSAGGPMPVFVFLPILEFCRKGIPNGVQTKWNICDDLSCTEANQKTWSWSQKCHEASTRQEGAPMGDRRTLHPREPLVAPLTYFFRLYILLYPRSIKESHETTFPPPQPSVPVRSHLGAFSRDLPEGESITGGFYINTKASPMKCGEFTQTLGSIVIS